MHTSSMSTEDAERRFRLNPIVVPVELLGGLMNGSGMWMLWSFSLFKTGLGLAVEGSAISKWSIRCCIFKENVISHMPHTAQSCNRIQTSSLTAPFPGSSLEVKTRIPWKNLIDLYCGIQKNDVQNWATTWTQPNDEDTHTKIEETMGCIKPIRPTESSNYIIDHYVVARILYNNG